MVGLSQVFNSSIRALFNNRAWTDHTLSNCKGGLMMEVCDAVAEFTGCAWMHRDIPAPVCVKHGAQRKQRIHAVYPEMTLKSNEKTPWVTKVWQVPLWDVLTKRIICPHLVWSRFILDTLCDHLLTQEIEGNFSEWHTFWLLGTGEGFKCFEAQMCHKSLVLG